MSADEKKEAKGASAVIIAIISLLGTAYNTWTTYQVKQEAQRVAIAKDQWNRANDQYDKYRASADRHEQQNKQAEAEMRGKYWLVSVLNSCGKDVLLATVYTGLDGASYGVGFYPMPSGGKRALFYTAVNEFYLYAEAEADSKDVVGGQFLFDVRNYDGFHYVNDEAWKSRSFPLPGNWVRQGFKEFIFPPGSAFGDVTVRLCE